MPVRVNRQVNLLTNPNCVLYAADATDVLTGRPWVDVQRVAAKALQRFHQASTLDGEVLFSWRINLDRKNRRHTQVTMLFVIDGPATEEQLAEIDTVMLESAFAWSGSSIERIPSNALHSLLIRAGEIHQIWGKVGHSAYSYRLALHGATVRTHRTTPERARRDAFLPGVVHAVGLAVPPADQDLERMRLAFAERFTTRVIEADGRIDPEEEIFMASVFPHDALQELGVSNPKDRAMWLERALDALPSRLGHHDKLALVGLLFSACYSDGSLDAREMKVLKEAGEALGLTKEDVVKYLRRFW